MREIFASCQYSAAHEGKKVGGARISKAFAWHGDGVPTEADIKKHMLREIRQLHGYRMNITIVRIECAGWSNGYGNPPEWFLVNEESEGE